jgi:ABC-type multidrug transport system ATPase subunit
MTATANRSALKVTGLRKAFGGKVVLDGIDLDVAEGTTFSLLGPNGAGKTTTVQILSTLLSPDAGEVHVAGFNLMREPGAVRAAIGVTGQLVATYSGGMRRRLDLAMTLIGTQRHPCGRLVRRYHGAWLHVGPRAVQPQPDPLAHRSRVVLANTVAPLVWPA